MQKTFDPYGGEITTQRPNPHGPVEDHSGGAFEQQLEIAKRSLAYPSRFETPAQTAGAPNDEAERWANIDRASGGK